MGKIFRPGLLRNTVLILCTVTAGLLVGGWSFFVDVLNYDEATGQEVVVLCDEFSAGMSMDEVSSVIAALESDGIQIEYGANRVSLKSKPKWNAKNPVCTIVHSDGVVKDIILHTLNSIDERYGH